MRRRAILLGMRLRFLVPLGCALGCHGPTVPGESDSDGGASVDAAEGWDLVYSDPAAEQDDALHAMWAADSSSVFAVGTARQVVSYDGIRWHALVKTSGAPLYGVWGASATDVVAVGRYVLDNAPAAFYFDGDIWATGGPFPSGVTPLTDAWGWGTQHYFTGLDGHIYQDDPVKYPNNRYHTAVITGGCPLGNPESPHLWGIDGSGIDNILVVGGGAMMAHRDTTGWATFCGPDTTVHYSAVHLIPGTREFYVGSNYLGLLRWRGRAQPLLQIHENREVGADEKYLQGIWASSAADVVAVGHGGTILHFDGAGGGARPIPSPTTDVLNGVVGVGERTLYICGGGNRIWRGEIPERGSTR
jgi:hypothetical protein